MSLPFRVELKRRIGDGWFCVGIWPRILQLEAVTQRERRVVYLIQCVVELSGIGIKSSCFLASISLIELHCVSLGHQTSTYHVPLTIAGTKYLKDALRDIWKPNSIRHSLSGHIFPEAMVVLATQLMRCERLCIDLRR